jgi:hypothetical protein
MFFRELGVEFPLFEAPVEATDDYRGGGTCGLCGGADAVTFELGIGADVIVACAACGVDNALDAEDGIAEPCRACGVEVPFPAAVPVRCCAPCLRGGRAAITKDTPLGLVRWIDAIDGVTHGAPRLTAATAGGFEVLPARPHGEWPRARVPREHLLELLRTPSYVAWQGDRWFFHCVRPMVFIAEWTSHHDFLARAGSDPDAAYALFARAVDLPDPAAAWEALVDDDFRGSFFVFECRACAAIVAHWDHD